MQGHIAGRTAGLLLLLFGLVVYLHGAWATVNAVLSGANSPNQVVSLGSVEVLQGPLGIAMALLAIVLFAVFTQTPIRIRPALKPGTMEFFVAVDSGYRKNKCPFPSNKNVLVEQGVVKHVDPCPCGPPRSIHARQKVS